MTASIRLLLRSGLPLAAACLLALCGPAAAQEGPTCSDCHDVDPAAFEKTVHGGFSCTDCHTAAMQEDHGPEALQVDCATCHQDAVDALQTSIHATPVFTQISGKPACQTCHGPVHSLVPRSDPASPIHPTRLAITCAKCHASEEIAKATGVRLIQPLAAFQASVHARGLQEGKPAADCSSCHGSHGILPASAPESRVNHLKVPETCGTCHSEIAKAFEASVHGQAAARGVREAPVCTDCHGEHRILSHEDPDSPVFASNVPSMTCGRCHGDLRVTQKFDMPGGVVATFEDSFHGLAGRTGSQTVANCASCHGVHNILPSSDPRSMVNKANLAQTCGNCHPGAGTRFAIGAVHVDPTAQEHAAVYWVRLIYLWLIWGVIGGMVLHNILDLRRKVLSGLARPVVPRAQRRQRMSLGFRIAHWLLMVTFTALVYTGFALKYPEHWWARPLLALEEQWALRGILHRIAAMAMLGAFAFHLIHLLVDRRARACMMRMWPNLEDVHEFKERVKWFFGRRPDMPKSGPLGYAEKAEYLALMWGTVVMALTGFLLWFENFTLTWFPKWVSDVSTVIHFYEAVLATLAILVWHFYFVMLDPLVYPMDTAWLTGKEAPGRTFERTESVVSIDHKPAPPQPEPAIDPAGEGEGSPEGSPAGG